MNTAAITDTVLSIVNDGDGTICGLTYAQRCQDAEFGLIHYRAACKKYSDYRQQQGERKLTRQELIEAAAQVQDYYDNHMRERKRLAKIEGRVL
jgi:hypothetical protein